MGRWIAVMVMALSLGSLWAGETEVRTVALERVKELYDARQALFVDSRSFDRYFAGTIPGAWNLPPRRFEGMSRWLPQRKDATILLFGEEPGSGEPGILFRRLQEAGYRNVFVYPGGYREWKRHGLPIMAAAEGSGATGEESPRTKEVKIDGVTLYHDPEDESHVDVRWIGPLLERGEIPEGLHLIDVRPASQYARAHLPGAVNLPFDPEKMEIEHEKLPKRGPIVFTCKHGSISTDAWFSLPEELQERVFILHAEVLCKEHNCTVRPH